jgi:hypothetical protein
MDESELTPYEAEQQRLRDVARLILPLESQLRRLPKDHIEEVVIWLKNIHNPSDPEDRSVEAWNVFRNRVAEIRNSPEQIDFQNRGLTAMRSAICAGILIGGLAMVAVFGAAAGWYVLSVLLIGVPYLWRRALQFSRKSILIYKDQEQSNLWAAIREAKNFCQLGAAGFFAFLDVRDFEAVTQHMRDAIYCNGGDGHNFATHMEELRARLD